MRSIPSSFLAVAGLVAALGLALAAPHAVSADGAQPTGSLIYVNDCTDDGAATTCYTARGEQHGVCTASGGCNLQINVASQCVTVTDDVTSGLLYQDCVQNAHSQLHTDNAGDQQIFREAFSHTYTDSTGQTSCYAVQYHAANGQAQYDRFTTDC